MPGADSMLNSAV